MRANIGDRLIVESAHLGAGRRVGVITEISHADHTPPYRVHWLDTGHDALVFPGPDARVRPRADDENPVGGPVS